MRLPMFLQRHRLSTTIIAAVAALVVIGSFAAASTRPHPLIAGPIDYEATTAGAVIEGINSGSGIGVEGVTNTTSPAGAIALQGFGTSTSLASVGVNGQVSGPSSTALIGNANNTDATHPSIGLEGFSQSGEGVFAESLSSSFPSLRSVDGGAIFDVRLSDVPNADGITSSLNAVVAGGAVAVAGIDNSASTSNNAGVLGATTNGLAGVGGLGSTTAPGVIGIGIAGVSGVTHNGVGVIGQCLDTATGEFVGATGSTINFSVDCTGHVTSTVVTRHKLAATSYTMQTTEPMLEDVGQTQLINGAATVHLDPAFADAISDRVPYLVFLTPQGDSRGLYATHITQYGFDVRENQGGRSSLAFDYRIVAKPADAHQPRMSLGLPRTDAGIIGGQRLAITSSRLLAMRAARARRAAMSRGIYEPRFGSDGKLHSAPLLRDLRQ